jgi:putative restriction endonuclease
MLLRLFRVSVRFLRAVMDDNSADTLDAFLADIRSMKLHASRTLGAALKKPLLLLLLVSRIENGQATENRFDFANIRRELEGLIRSFGGRPSRSGPRAEQPFSHLRSSPFWTLRTQRQYESGHTALISDLMNPASYGAFDPAVFVLLRKSETARARVVDAILTEWWPTTLHGDLREELGLDRLVVSRRRRRDRQFTVDVLENFRYSCALCGFHGLLNGQATGIDAAHVRWHSADGPDAVENGIALCKLHHWAFDKGILGIDESLQIQVADSFVAQVQGGLPLESLAGRPLAAPPRAGVGDEFLAWHRSNVYLGA